MCLYESQNNEYFSIHNSVTGFYNREKVCFLGGTKCIYVQRKLTLYSPVVTLCTTRFNIQKFYVLPTQCIYVFCTDLRTNSDYFPTRQ
jgi:hypothetical protein